MISGQQLQGEGLAEQAVRLVSAVLAEAHRAKLSRLQFELSDDHVQIQSAEEIPRFETFSSQSPGLGTQVLNYFTERSYFWPDADDEVMASNNNKTKRLLVSPPAAFPMLADVSITKKIGTTSLIVTLSNIRIEGIRPLEDLSSGSQYNQAALQHLLAVRRGIVLASCKGQLHQLDGCSTLVAVRPDSVLVHQCQTEEAAQAVLSMAERQLVVVGVHGNDAVDISLNFLGLFGTSAENAERALRLLSTSFVHAYVRRVCAACAKSTPVDSRTIDRLPTVLRAGTKSSYMFGRGCEQCGHSAYRGQTGISSIVAWDDSLKQLYRGNNDGTALTREVYRRGARSLIEDGLSKIFSGLTSFEEVLAITSQVSSAFAAAITSTQSETEVTPQSTKLESRDEDTFLAKYDHSVPAPQPGGKQRVLIVEDDGDQRSVLGAVFENEGYEVLTAENGQVAYQSLKQKPVDVIICDLMMPVMNGAQLIKLLKDSPALKNIPVLMLTAVHNPDAEYALLKQGADDYCEKNVKKKVLLTRVERLLAKRKKNPLEHMLGD